MQTAVIEFSRTEAIHLMRKYKEHKAYQTPADAEILRLAGMIAKGKVIIQALRSIQDAGLNDEGLPKLAIARADAKKVYLEARHDGSAIMHLEERGWLNPRMAASRRFDFSALMKPSRKSERYSAIVPHIPPDIRPKRGLQNYHILWEAEWGRTYPVDPMLLRRIGKTGDTWIVVAAWDLTPVERAVLGSRQ